MRISNDKRHSTAYASADPSTSLLRAEKTKRLIAVTTRSAIATVPLNPHATQYALASPDSGQISMGINPVAKVNTIRAKATLCQVRGKRTE